MEHSDENTPPLLSSKKRELSLEQRQRIDHNFKAAKAILSRKRPLLDTSKSSPPTWAPLPFQPRIDTDSEQIKHFGELTTSHSPAHSAVDISYRSPSLQNDHQRLPRFKQGSTNVLHSGGMPILHSGGMPNGTPDPKSYNPSTCAYSSSLLQRTPLAAMNPNTYACNPMTMSIQRDSFSKQNSQVKISQSPKTCSLQLEMQGVLSPDSDFDVSVLQQLDAYCKSRGPAEQLITNRSLDNDPRLSQKLPHLPSASVEISQSAAVESREESSNKSHQDLLKVTDSSSSLSAMRGNASEAATYSSSSIVVNQVSSVDEPSMSVITSIPEQQGIQADFDVVPVDNCSSNGPSNSHSDPQTQQTHETVLSCHGLSPLVNALAGHMSPSSTPILETSSCELSANVSYVMPAYLQALNESQREAVLSDINKPLLILAGPGSGKTSTMVARLLRLLSEGVHATNVLAMTFTTAAATEMKDRVGVHVGKSVSKELNVCTFHSFCLQLCRTHADKLERSTEFLVYGNGQQRRAVVEATRLALPDLHPQNVVQPVDAAAKNLDACSDKIIDPRSLKERAKKWDKFVTQAKASGRAPEYFESLGNVAGAAILRHYNATLAACDALDYHDLINCTVALLRGNSEVLKECLSTWTCILVDEFQDTSTMQYQLLCLLASHKRITVVGDDDQSIFSFNGADSNNFCTFRKDFNELKEVRLQHNYRSTRCIVEAASALIGNNMKRCENKRSSTGNDYGDLITVKECRNLDAQCCFVTDTIMMKAQVAKCDKPMYGNFAILYRCQVTGKLFQQALRLRRIPFNVHGVAFYRKKIVKVTISMLWAALDNNSIHCSRVYKALYGGDKAESKKVVEYVEKVAKASKHTFLEAARSIFTAKVSGTFSRQQLARGRKVLTVIDAIHRLVRKEPTLSTLITTVVNLIPQRSAFEKQAVVDATEGKFLNEDNDPRTVLEYLLDDVSDFLGNHFNHSGARHSTTSEHEDGCLLQLKAFLDHMTLREHGNFKTRSQENKNSVTLTTLHQSKGLEWDVVFIVKLNDSEIPLLHETMGSICDGAMSIEEERRLFYVGMTRAKKKLYILYVTWDSNQQLLRPSRFLRELPRHLLDYKINDASIPGSGQGTICLKAHDNKAGCIIQRQMPDSGEESVSNQEKIGLGATFLGCKSEDMEPLTSTEFLKGFNVDARSTIASIFHSWAKKPAFQEPKRLLDKVAFVLDERMCSKASKNKDTLRALKCSLDSNDALLYAQHVLMWLKTPQEERALMQSEKQKFFQHSGAEMSMGAASATTKQISYLRTLGCTIEPTSRLHASKLIEQYKKL